MAPAAVPVAAAASELTVSAMKADLAKSTKPQLDASKLTYTFNKHGGVVPALDDPIRREHNSSTDHMLTVKWTEKGGWEAPQLRPYGHLDIMPTASCIHYATQAFEGMKAYRGVDGKLRLFRPDLNCKRMNLSSTRIALPAIDPEQLEELVKNFVSVDCPKWLPDAETFIYLRPAVIASGAALGVQKPREATLFIIAVLFPPMEVLNGMRLLASKEDMGVRAWPGGHGWSKVGANYGPTLQAQGEARERGFDQILWLLGSEGRVTEAGASNFFVVWKNKNSGRLELITAPLGDKIILDGVTRRSVIELAKSRLSHNPTEVLKEVQHLEKLDVVEQSYTIDDIAEAYESGRLVEAFACGTAFFVAPISYIQHEVDKGIEVPMNTTTADGCKSGVYAAAIKTWLKEIMYGKVSHPWGVVINERGAQ
ncbi:hypothetical protein TWF225_011188 [Orbilia oligospora]|nr:hypothetical protein TWF751_000534 [Orbilia oligospora]KAF3169974.1 hypothetical protein TWF225_011188 [Orbilia oligospora]KAF3248190.1 hypothetical protein TWF217_009164 [Orbilia oligospora]KAF3250432.1 hypothetical protein TWF128_007574 [Orbilia oligospora]